MSKDFFQTNVTLFLYQIFSIYKGDVYFLKKKYFFRLIIKVFHLLSYK